LTTPSPLARLEREAAFHDRAFSEKTRAAAGKFYAVAQGSKQFYRDLLLRHGAGKRVLEYGCGTGSCAFDLARRGAAVAGIDIAPVAIELARERAAAEGLAGQVSFQVMDAESLEFSAGRFDLVCGSGILHHLDLERALGEIGRVLKPEGRAVFFEPLGHNPLINLYRWLTPRMRTPDEHPLRAGDLAVLGRFFARVEVRYFHLLSLAAVPLRALPGFGALLGALEALDHLRFRIPRARRHAWIAVMELSRPRASAGQR